MNLLVGQGSKFAGERIIGELDNVHYHANLGK